MDGISGIRSLAEYLNIPYTTFRGWIRSFSANAKSLASGFDALTIHLSGNATNIVTPQRTWCLASMRSILQAATNFPSAYGQHNDAP